MGWIGVPDLSANLKAPNLKGSNDKPFPRVPSGNIKIENNFSFCFRFASIWSRTSEHCALSRRFINISPSHWKTSDNGPSCHLRLCFANAVPCCGIMSRYGFKKDQKK